MAGNTLRDALVDEVKDSYNAEKQLTKVLPKLVKAATRHGERVGRGTRAPRYTDDGNR